MPAPLVVQDVEVVDAGPPQPGPGPPEPARRRLAGLGVVLVLAAGLAALLVLPQPAVPGRTASAAGLESWPARGPAADDARLLRAAATAWEAAAARGDVLGHGGRVEPLYLDREPGASHVVLRARAADGRMLVAVGTVGGDRSVRIDRVEPVPGAPPALVLPDSGGVRLLLAPDQPASQRLVVRKRDSLWQRVGPDEHGLTVPVRALGSRLPPVLGVVDGLGGERGVTTSFSLLETSLAPAAPPVELVSPSWGSTGPPGTDQYDAAVVALRAVPEPTRRVAVLADTRTGVGRVVLAEVVNPADGIPRHYLVRADATGQAVLQEPPTVTPSLAMGLAPLANGRLLVLVASAPSIPRVEVRAGDGRTLIDGLGPTSVVLPAPAPREIAVLGKRTNGSVVASLRLDVAAELVAPDNEGERVQAASGRRGR